MFKMSIKEMVIDEKYYFFRMDKARVEGALTHSTWLTMKGKIMVIKFWRKRDQLRSTSV